MALLCKIFILLFIVNPCFALIQTKLKELATKQNVYNLRYFSDDGKFTYYQNSKGNLLLSKNYHVYLINKGHKNDQYYFTQSNNKKNILIEYLKHFLTSNNIIKDNSLFYSKIGEQKLNFLAKGTSPALHLNDQYISYFNISSRKIVIVSTKNKALSWSILIGEKINPYFVPIVEMLDEKNIIFTTLTKEGIPIIIKYNLQTKQNKQIYRADSPKIKIESCKRNDRIYIGIFSIRNFKNSSIFKINKNLNLKEIYSSKNDDLGNMICSSANGVYFIKQYISKEDGGTNINSDIFLLKDNKKLLKKSDLVFVRQLVQMQSSIIVPFHGKFFVIEGINDLTLFDKILK